MDHVAFRVKKKIIHSLVRVTWRGAGSSGVQRDTLHISKKLLVEDGARSTDKEASRCPVKSGLNQSFRELTN